MVPLEISGDSSVEPKQWNIVSAAGCRPHDTIPSNCRAASSSVWRWTSVSVPRRRFLCDEPTGNLDEEKKMPKHLPHLPLERTGSEKKNDVV